MVVATGQDSSQEHGHGSSGLETEKLADDDDAIAAADDDAVTADVDVAAHARDVAAADDDDVVATTASAGTAANDVTTQADVRSRLAPKMHQMHKSLAHKGN
ncbi:hypothetical protein QQS21_005468 [Conoideocrella luteorostrata]|uniref:Uncharacterized protein n=1 Tax=Conoideocrella luteorostrata TaxID=1105319 RepID=A0AAJ0G0W8_9HYPO|nr:hypothetical protein QQS21_005468 [Conoideocrella luteorostrata]